MDDSKIKLMDKKQKKLMKELIKTEKKLSKTSDGIVIDDKKFKKYMDKLKKVEAQVDALNDKYSGLIERPDRVDREVQSPSAVKPSLDVKKENSEFHIKGIKSKEESVSQPVASNNNEPVFHIRGIKTKEEPSSQPTVSNNNEPVFHIRGVKTKEEPSSQPTISNNNESVFHIRGIKKNDSRAKTINMINTVNDLSKSGVVFELPDASLSDVSLEGEKIGQLSKASYVVADYTMTSICYQKKLKEEEQKRQEQLHMQRKLSKGNVSLGFLISIILFVFSLILFFIK